MQNSSFVLDVQWNQRVMNIERLGYSQELVNVNSNWNVDPRKHHFPSEIWGTRPMWEMVLKIISMLPIFIIGTLANVSLIHVIARTKTLQTTTNLLIINMSIADLATCLICPWMFLCTDLYQKYIMGSIGCRLDGMLVHALTLVAVFNLSVISYDRLSAIVFNCSGKLTVRTTNILLCVTWLCGITVAAPLAYFRNYYERQWKDYLETYCMEDTALIYPYWHIFAGLSVWAPLTIMAMCYSAILVKLDRYETQALKSKHPIAIRYKSRVARILALIVLAFIICRVPFTALIIRRTQLLQEPVKVGHADSIYVLWYISRYLVLANAAINPLLYGCSSIRLRRELAACPAVSWLICQKKRKVLRTHSVSQYKPQQCSFYLRSCSPCIGRIPNISSGITINNSN